MKTKNFTQNAKRAMKHFSFLIFLFSFAFAFASCSKSEEAPIVPQSGEQTATFNIEAPATRGDVSGLSRYILEAYEGKDLATTPLRVEAATGSLTLELKKNTDYTFVFWADNGTAKTESVESSGYYNTDKLQEVVVSAGKESTLGEMAYCLAVSFNSKAFEANKSVTLKNATAQINFVEAAGLTAADNSLIVKYSSGGKLNVATGVITEIGLEISRTYSNIAQIAKDGTLTTDYILAPLGEKRLLDLKVTFNTEPEKTISAVPFQQSYKTNIKGEFSNLYASVFTISNEVEDYTNNPDVEFPDKKLKVGSFYYSDNTFSNNLDTDKTCIGIVYVVNADGKSGKIVGLTEATDKRWGAMGLLESTAGINSTSDGATATKNLIAARKGDSNFATDYSAFNWVYTTANNSDINGRWYIPAHDELKALYAAWNGDATTTTNNAARAAFNTPLTTASGTGISDDIYWSSTQSNANSAWDFYFYLNNSLYFNKNFINSVRVVSAF